MTPFQKLQQAVWHLIYPIFPYLQQTLHFLHEKNRQRYHLGWLAEGKTLAELKQHLKSVGFGNHFIAWQDPGQVLSWRKLVSFREQYHIRVFNDGEIRGHFELTPEAHPIKHFREVGEGERADEFRKFLGDFVAKEKYISELQVDASMQVPHQQHTYRDALKMRSV